MVIRILDHVQQCSSYEDGEVIYKLISGPVANGQDVSLSFAGVDALPSAFVNASIVRLVEVATLSAIRQHLKILDSTKQINELIRNRIAFVETQQKGL